MLSNATKRMMKTEELFTCKRCGLVLPRSSFYADIRSANGVSGWCKKCHRNHRFKNRGLDRARRILARFSNAELQAELERRLKEWGSKDMAYQTIGTRSQSAHTKLRDGNT